VVRLWVAHTDHDWFDFLSSQPDIDEVNFWQPTGSSNFGMIRPGELFLFRLKSPRNAIGGYGVFSHVSNLPISLAWEAFGIKNGASTFGEMRQRVGKYRGQTSQYEDYTIECRIVVQPVFLPSQKWIPQPASWARSIVWANHIRPTNTKGGRYGMPLRRWAGLPPNPRQALPMNNDGTESQRL